MCGLCMEPHHPAESCEGWAFRNAAVMALLRARVSTLAPFYIERELGACADSSVSL